MSAAATELRTSPATALAEPHHDGSDFCVLERPDRLGGEAVVRICLPRGTPADMVAVRYVKDGEPHVERAEIDVRNEEETWWRARIQVVNPLTRYRWLLGGRAGRVGWVNGLGLVRHDVPDDDDFVIGIDRGGPDWHLRSVVYEVFPDRFAAGEERAGAPSWAVPRAWDDGPTGRGPATPFEWFGGDLTGVEQHLDHVESLGASAVYLTPFFPAGSTHRYDASSFEHVDSLLGGDRALESLTRAAHARGLRVIGDLTLNHTGDEHDWFAAAREGPDAPGRLFYHFDDALPGGYASWLGVLSLPKLDWRSGELRARMAAVVRHWLKPPFELDGWRMDVANMTGRYGDVDVSAAAAATVRAAVEEAKSDALLVAEHAHDFRADLARPGWHGVMNYSGFLRPVWWWLRSDAFPEDPFTDAPAAHLGGADTVATMRAFRAGIPWPTVLHSWTLLDSHDTARFRTVSGTRARHVVGVGLQMTTPGVPMVFAGDEIGLEGDWGEDARRTMPWSRPETWDRALLGEFRRLTALRRASEALARGGIRYVHVANDALAYLRQAPGERILCLASRAGHEPVRLPLASLGCETLEPLYGGEATLAGGEATLPADGPAFHVWRLS